MATYPVLTVGDGVIEIPEELKSDPRLQPGARFRLISSQGGPLVFQSADPESAKKPKGDWRRLRGALAHLDVRLTDEMDRDRQLENERDTYLMRGSFE